MSIPCQMESKMTKLNETQLIDRLSRIHTWRREYSERVVNEYKRFLHLRSMSIDKLEASEAVQAAQRLHSPESLTGSSTASSYQDTLNFYTAEFRTPPPEDIWPRRAAQDTTWLLAILSVIVLWMW